MLAVIATGSFAIAFGEEKLSQLWESSQNQYATCLKQVYRDTPPVLQRERLKKDRYPLCFQDFTVLYSGVSKTPLWSAEYLTPERLSIRIPREDQFHEEMRVLARHRALLSDYSGSGYDRGHLAPNADMNNTVAQYDSFSLANIVPQHPKNNQQVWRELEEATRAVVTKHKQDVYVISGPVFSEKRLKTIGSGVIVPTALFKAVYLPQSGVIGAYFSPNNDSQQVNIMSVCALEELLGINLFPQLTEQEKRNVYQLPLTANQVKVNKELVYLYWDRESQCAEEVSATQIRSVQQAFQSQTFDQHQTVPNLDVIEPASIVDDLIQMLLQYILQSLR